MVTECRSFVQLNLLPVPAKYSQQDVPLCNALHGTYTVTNLSNLRLVLCRLVGSRRIRPFPDVTLAEREVEEPMTWYIFRTQLSRLVASTSFPPSPMMSWSSSVLSWPFQNRIVFVMALILRCQFANATKCRQKAFIVDSSNPNAGITYCGRSWNLDYDDPSAGVFFFGGSTMRAINNGDSLEFVFTGPSIILASFGQSFQRLTRVMVGHLQETPLRSSEMSGQTMQTSPLK